jgi:hypothetical protein
MRRVIRSAALVLALSGALLAVTLAAPSPASADYSGCWGNGGVHTDNWGNSYGTAYCHAYLGGDVQSSGIVRGYLYAGDSWFVCQEQFVNIDNPPVDGAYNNWWLYTQADTSTGDGYQGWGWFPANRISGGGNYEHIPNLRDCSPFLFAAPLP